MEKDLFDKIKSAILSNTVDKTFGCIHCKEDSELVIDEVTLMVDDIKKIFDEEMSYILQHRQDSSTYLYAINFNPRELLYKFFNSQSDASSLPTEDREQLQTEWDDYIGNKNHFKSPFIKINQFHTK